MLVSKKYVIDLTLLSRKIKNPIDFGGVCFMRVYYVAKAVCGKGERESYSSLF